MAIVQNPLINRASGSVGNSVFSKWKKKNTLRAKSINPYPVPTSPQSASRAIFKNCSEFFLQLRDYFQYFGLGDKNSLSPLNQFVKQNRNLFTADANIITIDHITSLEFNFGKAPVPSALNFVRRTGSFFEYQIRIYPELGTIHDGFNSAIIAFNFDRKQLYFFLSDPDYLDNCSFTLPDYIEGQSVCFYAFLYTMDFKMSSKAVASNIYQ